MLALEILSAIEEIKQLMARRIRALDEKDWETYAACHADDHVSYALKGGKPGVGPQVITERTRRMVEGVTTVHMAHLPDITILSENEAEGRWVLEDRLWWKQGDEEHWYCGYGHYHDTYGKRGGRWLFTSRRLKRLRVEMSPGAVSPID